MSRKKNIDKDFVSGSFLSIEDDDDDDCSIHSKTMDEDLPDLQEVYKSKGDQTNERKDLMEVKKLRFDLLFDQELEDYLKKHNFYSYKRIDTSIISKQYQEFQNLALKKNGIKLFKSTETNGKKRNEMIETFLKQFNIFSDTIYHNLKKQGIFESINEENTKIRKLQANFAPYKNQNLENFNQQKKIKIESKTISEGNTMIPSMNLEKKNTFHNNEVEKMENKNDEDSKEDQFSFIETSSKEKKKILC